MKAGELINGYRLSSDGTTANGGRCVWAFGTKDGEEFFIKQFLSPKYPVSGGAPGSEKRKRRLKQKCERFEQQQNRFMTEFRKQVCIDGNLTVPVEFVRVGPFYYKIAPKIDVSSINVKDIAKLPLEKKLSIAKTAAHCVKTLHNMHIAHGDLKPNNILIKKTETGEFVATLIDFDDSFFEGEISENPEEVVGDFVYYSPELLRYIKAGGDELRAKVTCRSDIFALGIIYYQYFFGRLPAFNKSKYQYLAVSVLDGKRPGLGRLRLKNRKLTKLIAGMLSINPSDRPSAMEILDELKGIDCDRLKWGIMTRHSFAGRLKGTLAAKTKASLTAGMLSIYSSDRPSAMETLDELKGVDYDGLERDTTTRHSFAGRLKGTLVGKTKTSPRSESRDPISGTGTRPTVSKWLKSKLVAKRKGRYDR